MTLIKKKKQKYNELSNFMTPSQARVFNMDRDILISHYSLIMLNKSSLLAEQRRLVENRVAYGVIKGLIKESELDEMINELKQIQ